jgi:hypothetical protein
MIRSAGNSDAKVLELLGGVALYLAGLVSLAAICLLGDLKVAGCGVGAFVQYAAPRELAHDLLGGMPSVLLFSTLVPLTTWGNGSQPGVDPLKDPQAQGTAACRAGQTPRGISLTARMPKSAISFPNASPTIPQDSPWSTSTIHETKEKQRPS